MLENIPAAACHLSIGEIEVSDANGEGAKTAPFRMVARSGRPIDHPWWGRVVHDLEGMKLPDSGRVPVDYAHSSEVIGFANKFSTETGNLVGSGALVPYGDSDRAQEVIHKGRNGVPWQASISFGGTGIKLEKLSEGKTAKVNGFDLAGPAVIVREWPLRSIAVCHQGADQWTQTEFAGGDTVQVEYLTPEPGDAAMADSTQPTTQPATADATVLAQATLPVQDGAVEAPAAILSAEGAGNPATEPATVEAADRALRKAEGERFSLKFGDRAGHYFIQGFSFEEALESHLEWQAGEIARLTQLVSAKPQAMGDDAPVTFGEAVPPKKKEPAFKLPPGLI